MTEKETIDCPCGYGKDIGEDQKTCHVCGMDLTPLHHLRALPAEYFENGSTLLREGKLDEAVDMLTVASSLEPENAAYLTALGNGLAEKGLKEEAEEAYERALSVEPDNQEARQAKDELEKAEAEEQPWRKRILENKWLIALPVTAFLLGLLLFPLFQWAFKESPTAEESQPQEVNTLTLEEQVEEAISENESLVDLGIEVSAEGGFLILSGQVPSDVHHSFLLEIAENAREGVVVDSSGVSVAPAEIAVDVVEYTVEEGDCLAAIAQEFYGNGEMWPKLFAANWDKIQDPDEIEIGQVLTIPQD